MGAGYGGAPIAPSAILPGDYTVATLPTADASVGDKYARVTDLFGEKRDLVLCSQVGSSYFWQPVRPQYAKTIGGNASMTLFPLSTPSTLILTATLTANRTYTLSTLNAYPGAVFELVYTGTLGIFSPTIAGLDLGATLTMLLNTPKRAVFDAASFTWKNLPY